MNFTNSSGGKYLMRTDNSKDSPVARMNDVRVQKLTGMHLCPRFNDDRVGHAQISSAIEYRSRIVSSGNRGGKFGRESLSRRWVRRSGRIDAGQWGSLDVDTATRGLVAKEKKKRALELVPLVDYRYANLRGIRESVSTTYLAKVNENTLATEL